jgi:NAD(P)H-dependent flavin oxidoreductase YrpB (nitropropane dioxygenase family)
MANAFKAIRIATENGDNEKGVLTVGQVTGLVRDIPSVAELMERIVAEASRVRERLDRAIPA